MIKRQLQRPLDKSVIQEDVKDAKDVRVAPVVLVASLLSINPKV